MFGATPAGAVPIDFINSTPVAIPAAGTSGIADPYPSSILVSGVTGGITDVNVTLTGLNHASDLDVDVMLVGPGGQSVVLMRFAGTAPLNNVTLTFDDAAPGGLPFIGTINSGTYDPTDFGGAPFQPPAPAAPSAAQLSTFNGTDANGTWQLFIKDSQNLNVGSMASWTLSIDGITAGTTSVCTGAPAASFSDRAAVAVHAPSIDCLASFGFAQGFPDGTFKPAVDLTRGQIASFITRLATRAGVALPASPPDAFPGDDGLVHELPINQLAALGVLSTTTGQQGTSYGAFAPLRRDDMAQLLVNAFRVISGGGELIAGPDAFLDDTNGGDPNGTGTDNEDAINRLFAAGVTQGVTVNTYDPDGTVTRGQFASFFTRYIQVLRNRGIAIPR